MPESNVEKPDAPPPRLLFPVPGGEPPPTPRKPARSGSIFLIAIALLAALTFGIVKSGVLERKNPASDAVAAFHEQFNESHFGEIYDAASSELRKGVSREEFIKLLSTVHEKLGIQAAVKMADSHSLVTSARTIAFLTYNASFENGEAVESFTYVITENKPVLEAYKIASKSLEEPPPKQPAARVASPAGSSSWTDESATNARAITPSD